MNLIILFFGLSLDSSLILTCQLLYGSVVAGYTTISHLFAIETALCLPPTFIHCVKDNSTLYFFYLSSVRQERFYKVSTKL